MVHMGPTGSRRRNVYPLARRRRILLLQLQRPVQRVLGLQRGRI